MPDKKKSTKKSTVAKGKKIDADKFIKKIKFDENGLVPVITQEHSSGTVLMLAYMNEESLKLSLRSGLMTYWSRSRGELWKKGETSGDFQKIVEAFADCDGDTLLFKVEQTGNGACHTGEYSCFFQKAEGGKKKTINDKYDNSFEKLYSVMKEHKKELPKDSYLSEMFKSGLDKILSGMMKASADAIISSKNKDKYAVTHETEEVLFHALLILAYYDIDILEINKIMHGRFS